MTPLDSTLEIMLCLLASDEEKKREVMWPMVQTLRLLGLVQRSPEWSTFDADYFTATPELIRLAYQSDEFLHRACDKVRRAKTRREMFEGLKDFGADDSRKERDNSGKVGSSKVREKKSLKAASKKRGR
jgi:hypothetical protein